MCGDFESVLGYEPQAPMDRMAEKLTVQNRLTPANCKEITQIVILIETPPDGLCANITQIKETFPND